MQIIDEPVLTCKILDHLARQIDIKDLRPGVGLNLHLKLSSTLITEYQERRRRQEYQEETLQYFIRNGASIAMIAAAFRLSCREAQQKRREDSSCHIHGGRPRLPLRENRWMILDEWRRINRSTGRLYEKLRSLHEKFPSYSLSALWTVIHEPDPMDFQKVPAFVRGEAA